MVTDDEIKAANTLITHGLLVFTKSTIPHNKHVLDSGKIDSIRIAATYLKADGLIEIEELGMDFRYKLTTSGFDLQRSGKSYRDFLTEQLEKRKSQSEKDELDREHKKLQIEDVITKLNTINPEQLDFWRQQKARNKQATIIALIAAFFSFIAMLKSFGIL